MVANVEKLTSCVHTLPLAQRCMPAAVNTTAQNACKRHSDATYDEVHVAGHLVAQTDQVEDEVDADGEEGGQGDKLDPAVALVARVHDRADERDETQHLQGSACTMLRETLISGFIDAVELWDPSCDRSHSN